MATTHSNPHTSPPGVPAGQRYARPDPYPDPTSAEEHLLSESEELAVLREENVQLRHRVLELEQILEATTSQTEQMWTEQQKEYEMLLEEKSEVIRSLHQHVQELKEHAGNPGAGPAGEGGGDLATLQQELLAMKEQLDQERQQLEEDERSLMDQMREMELAMSKDRVELARQRSELQRLHQDLQHEIEQAQKDSGLRDRLIALQRRTQLDPGAAPAPGQPAPRRAVPTQMALPNPDQGTAKPGSGLLRRLFR